MEVKAPTTAHAFSVVRLGADWMAISAGFECVPKFHMRDSRANESSPYRGLALINGY